MLCRYCGAELQASNPICPKCGKAASGELNVESSENSTSSTEAAASRSPVEAETASGGSGKAASVESGSQLQEANGNPSLSDPEPESYSEAAVNAPVVQKPEARQEAVPGYFPKAFLALAIMLCCSILVGTGYCIYNLSHTKSLEGQLRRANSDNRTAELTIDDLNAEVSDLQDTLKTTQDENNQLNEQVSSLTDQVTTMEGQVSQYQYDASSARQDAQYAADQVDSLNETITSLENDLAAEKQANETLQAQYNDLQDENDQLTKESTAKDEKLAFYDQYVVFVMVGDKNKYYHSYDCSEFTKKSFLAYSVKLAEQNDYTPCPVCHPEEAAAAAATAAADQDN